MMYEAEQTLDELLSKEPPAPFVARIFVDPACPNRLCIVGTFASVRTRSNVMGGQNAVFLEGLSGWKASVTEVPDWAVDGGRD